MLYLVATPIGNLGDISYRAVETIRTADAIYCEDTRRTLQLLRYLEIEKPVVSLHEHNERSRSEEVVRRLKDGETIVYVSDAGMPAISDPGALLVEACILAEQPFTVVPGASAVLTAAILSGLPPQPFTFFGFLPRSGKERKEVLSRIQSTPHLCLLYESPHRVAKTLADLYEWVGDSPAAVLRELTKKFESVYRGTLSVLMEQFCEEPKGECVIAVLPQEKEEEEFDLDAALRELLLTHSTKDAAAIVASTHSVPKKVAYERALKLRP